MMKKIVTIMMVLIMCVSMVACSADKTVDTNAENNASIEQVETTAPENNEETAPADDAENTNITEDEEAAAEDVEENTTPENKEETSVAGDSNAKENENKTPSVNEEVENENKQEEQKTEETKSTETKTEESKSEETPDSEETKNETVTENTQEEGNKEEVKEEVKGETSPTEPEEENTIEAPVVNINSLEQGVFNIINQHRANAGLPALTFEYSFYNAAKTRASEAANHFSHTRPNGQNYTSVFGENGIKWDFIAGENVGRYFADAETAMNAFMNSQVHKDNILYAGYTRVCIAVVESELYPGYYVIEQLFAGPAGAY